MASPVAALYTTLTLESSQFIANSKRSATAAEKMSNDISKSLTAAKSAVTGFLAVAAVGFATSGIKNALNYAAAIGETSQQLGIATKSYQELSYAATQVGISQQELETGLSRLTRNIGQGAKVFGELGVAIRDTAGNSRATGDVFNDVAAKLGKIEDPAKRAAIEVEIFGKAGQKLDTLLSGGTAALGAMADEAARLGLVLSDKQIADADRAADTFARVNAQLKVNVSGAVADNAFAITRMAEAFGNLITMAVRGIGAINAFGDTASLTAAKIANSLPFASDATRAANNKTIDRVTKARRDQSLGFGLIPSIAAPVATPAGQDTAAKITTAKKDAPAATKAVFDFTAALESMAKVDASIAGEGGALSIFATDDSIYNDTVSKLTTLGDMTSLIQPIDLIDEKAIARVEEFGKSISSNLAQAIVYGQDIGTALVNSLKAAAAEAVASGIFKLLTGGTTGGGFAGIVSSIVGVFGGARANGGPVSGGKSYLVGERGPEILTGASGRIIPNHALGGMGGGGGNVFHIDARGATDPAAVRAQVIMGIAQAAPALIAETQGRTIARIRRPMLAGGRG